MEKASWVMKKGHPMRHFGEPESAKALCGVALWTAQVTHSQGRCCIRCLQSLKDSEMKLSLEIVSYYCAWGKNWTEDQVAQFEAYQDENLQVSKAIQQQDPAYVPCDWAQWIKDRQKRAQAAQEVAHA